MSWWGLTQSFVFPAKTRGARVAPLGRDWSALPAGVSPSSQPRHQLPTQGGESLPSPSPLNQVPALKCIKRAQAPAAPGHLRSAAPGGGGRCPPAQSQRRRAGPRLRTQEGESPRQIDGRSLAGCADRQTLPRGLPVPPLCVSNLFP